jgi:hypothetical protein
MKPMNFVPGSSSFGRCAVYYGAIGLVSCVGYCGLELSPRLSGFITSHCDASETDCRKSKSLLIVKFGGSAVTQKNMFETLKMDSLSISSKQIKKVHSESCWTGGIVVVHGAGELF